MHKSCFYLICTSLLMLSGTLLFGQQLSFKHFGAQQGLRSLFVFNCSIDKYGFIWVSTYDGLVRFDGKNAKYYDVNIDPQRNSDQIRYVYCDRKNNIWACTPNGLIMLDEHRQIHHQIVMPDDPYASMRFCFEDSDNRIYALTRKNAFSKGPDESHWNPERWLDTLLPGKSPVHLAHFDKDRVLLTYPTEGVLLVNLKERKKEAFIRIQSINCATRYDDDHILIGRRDKFELILASISDPAVYRTVEPPGFFKLDRQHEQIMDMVRAADNHIYMATGGEGLLVMDSSLRHYKRYVHDPADPYSIIDNALRAITTDTTGKLLIASGEGVNYTNVKNAAITYINYLKDTDGKITDDRVSSFAEDKNQQIWLCTRSNVFIYDPIRGTVQPVTIPVSSQIKNKILYPIFITKDNHDKMWVAFRNEGIGVFNPDGIIEKFLSPEDHPEFAELIEDVRILQGSTDGYIYAGAQTGFFRINDNDHTLDTFAGHPDLRPLRNDRIIDILPVDNGIWVTTSPNGGAWHYSFVKKELTKYGIENGLAHHRVYGITKDTFGDVFVGTYNGLSIINQIDSIVNFTKGQGLIGPQIEAIEADNDGNVWMTNTHTLLKYDGKTKTIYKLGSRQGSPVVNYPYNASAKLPSGKILFGASRGFLIIDPSMIRFDQAKAKLFVFYRDENDDENEIDPGSELNFKYSQSQLRFSFALSDLVINDQVTYRYKLISDGEVAWSNPTSNSFIEFSLDPGKYGLVVQAYDGYDWIGSDDPIQLSIHPPWWKAWWFLMSAFLIAVAGLWFYYRLRIKKYKTELIVARQISDLESKALRAQMNPHFVFNSLNAIQECIVTGSVDEAYTYLTKFSRLLRLVLEHSDIGEVSLQEELEVLDLYISLEKLRFKDDMHYQFELDDDLDPEEIWMPPMLIQPHIENAIWHGLRHKEGEKNLTFSIKETSHDYLEVCIQDDGIGRAKAAYLKKDRLGGTNHQSKGRQLSENRMELLRKAYPLASIDITDLYGADGEAAGTKVVLMIPMLKKTL